MQASEDQCPMSYPNASCSGSHYERSNTETTAYHLWPVLQTVLWLRHCRQFSAPRQLTLFATGNHFTTLSQGTNEPKGNSVQREAVPHLGQGENDNSFNILENVLIAKAWVLVFCFVGWFCVFLLKSDVWYKIISRLPLPAKILWGFSSHPL